MNIRPGQNIIYIINSLSVKKYVKQTYNLASAVFAPLQSNMGLHVNGCNVS